MSRNVNQLEHHALTPLYARYLIRLIRPLPNWDFFFIRSLRRKAVLALHLDRGNRALDAGCGPGGSFPYLVDAVGASGEVVGVEISPEISINARNRIEANRWTNVRVVEGDAATVQLTGKFDGLVIFAAPDVYASPEALDNLLPYLNADARVVVFGAKLSNRRSAALLNLLLRLLMKLSFSSTPRLNHEPWRALKTCLDELKVEEHFCGCMFLAWGSIRNPLRDCKGIAR